MSKIIITGCQIMCSKIVTADITLSKPSFFLVQGIVYSPEGVPLPNAAIEVRLVDNSYASEIEKNLGVTFSDFDGSFGISLPRVAGKQYKLIAYSSV